MVTEPQMFDLVDPLHGQLGLSHFPQTIRASTNAPKLTDTDDLESIHEFMKSMELRSPKKHLEEAKAVVNGGLELPNSNFASFMTFIENNDTVAEKGKEKPKERRQGLDRKRQRARFSLKPKTSQPFASLEPTLDITKLEDPEDFFAAYERHENAKKEIQRQKGMTDLNEFIPSTNAQLHRPGILGKKASYKHRYLSVFSENNDTLISSQETLGQDVLSPPNCDLQQETTNPNVESQEMKLDGSIAKSESRLNQIFDELLSSNIEDLEGGGALHLLQERLQIKPIDLGKPCLLDFHDIGRNFMVLGEKLPKPRKVLPDVQNLLNGMSSRTPILHKYVGKTSNNLLESPTPPKNPLAAIALLKERILPSNLPGDSFSPLNVDISASRNHHVEHIDKQSDQIDTQKELSIYGKLNSLDGDEITKITVANTSSSKVGAGGSVPIPEKSVNGESSRQTVGIDVRPSGSDEGLEDCDNRSNDLDEKNLYSSVNRPNTDADDGTNGHGEMHDNVEDMPQHIVSSAKPSINLKDSLVSYIDTDVQMHGSIEMEVEDLPQNDAHYEQSDINAEDSTMKNLANSQSHSDQLNHVAFEDHDMDVPSTHSEIDAENYIQKHLKESSTEQSKAKRPPRESHQRKAVSHRHSLADAGTSMETGVRRSKRIRSRPLEYWKGERFLYGRVNNSLTTVIGLKYISPAKDDGKPTFRVKSYVSDNHKELVELAALH